MGVDLTAGAGNQVESTGLSVAMPTDAVSATCTVKAKKATAPISGDVVEFRLGGRSGTSDSQMTNATWDNASILARVDVFAGGNTSDVYAAASPIELPMPLEALTFWAIAETSNQRASIAVNFLKADGTRVTSEVTWA